MKKRKRWTLVGLAALLGAFLSFPVGAAKDGLEDAKNKMTALEQEKEKTEAVLKQLEGLKSDTAAYVKQLDTQLESLGDALLQLESDILAKEELIAVRQAELEEARQVEKNQYESMKLRIKYMYEKGESSYLDLLMESGSLSELLNRAEYITKISEYDRRQLDVYAATKERIAEAEKVLEAEHAVLLTMQEETEAKQASVEQLLATKQAELSEYENRITAAEGQLSEYQKDIEAQERAIQAIEAEIKRQEEEARRKAAEAGKSYKTISLGDIKFI